MRTFTHWCFVVNYIRTVLLTLLLILDRLVLSPFAYLWSRYLWSRYLYVVDLLKLWAFDWPFDWFWLWVNEWLLLLLHVDWMIWFFHFWFLLFLKNLALYTFRALFDWALITLLINDLNFLRDNYFISNWACFASARRRAWLTFVEMFAYLFWCFDWAFFQRLNSGPYFLFTLDITYFYFVVWMQGRNMTFHAWLLWFLVNLVFNR